MENSPNPGWLKYCPITIQKVLEGKYEWHLAIRNSGWIFFDKLLRAFLGVIVGAWVARYLGPSQFGELAYCIAFIAIFLSVTNLGLDGIVVREIVNHPRRANIVLGTTFQLRLWIGLLAWGCAIFLYGLTNSFAGEGIWIVALVGAGIIFQAADTVDLWFQGNSQSKRTVIAKICSYLISNTVRIALILLEAPLIAFAIVITLESALTAIALYVSYKRFPCNGKWQNYLTEAKKLLKESWPYLISGVSVMIYMRIDQIMIKGILGERELGVFAAIIPISSLWSMIPMAICASVAPIFARKRVEDVRKFEVNLALLFKIFWLTCFLIIGTTWVFSRWIIPLLYGDQYIEAITLINIYVLTCIPVFMGIGQNLWLINENKSYFSLIQTLIGAFLSIIGNLILLPRWGINGAACAAVLSFFVSAIGINFFLSRKLFYLQFGKR